MSTLPAAAALVLAVSAPAVTGRPAGGPQDSAEVRLRGRLCDWRGDALVDLEVATHVDMEYETRTGSGAGTFGTGTLLEIGRDGTFDWEAPDPRALLQGARRRLARGRLREREPPTELRAWLVFELREPGLDPHQDPQAVRLPLHLLPSEGVVDLGAVRLRLPFERRIHETPPPSDDEVEAEFWRVLGGTGARTNFDHAAYEACLSEMARRGGERWIGFLERAVARCEAERDERDSPFRFLGGFELWLALRRARREPDPFELVVRDELPLQVPFPELPAVRLELVNVDGLRGADPILSTLVAGGFRVTAVSAGGGAVPRRRARPSGGGGGSSWRFDPGDRRPGRCDLEAHLAPRTAGPFDVRVQYHADERIAHLPDVRDRMVVATRPFRVRWAPRVLPREEVEEARADLRALLDDVRPWTLAVIRDRRSPPTRRVGGGVDEVLALGWNVLPALLDGIEDPSAAVHRRAWMLAALHDLTGLVDPREVPSALGRYVEVPVPLPWHRPYEGPSRALGVHQRDVEAQEELVARWRALRGLVRVRE